MNAGYLIKKVRLEKNINQKDFASILGRSASFVNQFESGNALPSSDTIKKISDVLDIDFNYLFNLFEEQRKNNPIKKDYKNNNLDEKIKQIFDESYLMKISENIIKYIKSDVLSEIKKITDMKTAILPYRLFLGEEVGLRAHQIKSFTDSNVIQFMSISAIGLLNKAIPEIPESSVSLMIELILLNPKNEHLVSIRSSQLKDFEENKDPNSLKLEIIESIIMSYLISKTRKSTNVNVFLHDEIPLCRIEITGNKTLYLSFFRSQNENDKGVVQFYESSSNMYKAYSEYYMEVRHKNKGTRFNLDDVNVFKDQIKSLIEESKLKYNSENIIKFKNQIKISLKMNELPIYIDLLINEIFEVQV